MDSAIYEIGVVTVNVDKPDVTARAVNRLTGGADWSRNFVVVDNFSTDENFERLCTFIGSQVKIIRINSRVGIGKAFNHGISKLPRVKAVLLMHNDCFIDESSLQRLYRTLISTDRVGIVSPLIYDYHKPEEIYQAGGKRVHFGADFIAFNYHDTRPSLMVKPYIVEYVSLVAMLVKFDIFRCSGLLDEKLAGNEEDDLCIRARKRGFWVVVEPRAKAYHIGGTTTHINGNLRTGSITLWTNAYLYFLWKHYGKIGVVVGILHLPLKADLLRLFHTQSLTASLKEGLNGFKVFIKHFLLNIK